MFYLHETPCDRHIKHNLGGSSATSQFSRFVNTPTFGTDQSTATAGGGVTGWGISSVIRVLFSLPPPAPPILFMCEMSKVLIS